MICFSGNYQDISSFFEGILNLIKAIPWQLTVIFIVLFFRKEISSLLNRVNEISSTGAKFEPTGAKQKAAEDKPIDIANPDKVPLPNSTPAIENLKSVIKANVDKHGGDKISTLIHDLAVSRLSAHFGRVYAAIFGSQIEILRKLNSISKCSIEEAREYFKMVIPRDPNFYKNYSFDNWVKFMENNLLVKRTADFIEITPIGKDFLLYLTETSLLEDKPL